MLKSTQLILLLLCTISSFAQKERTMITGKVESDKKAAKDTHVINKTSNKGTISNVNGQFTISVKIGDTLILRGIQFESKEIVILENHIVDKTIFINLHLKTNILKEVTLKKTENIAMALKLPNAGKKPLKGVDLKLARYSQQSTPVVILAALLGQKGGISDVYNIISGNRKKHRKLKQLIEKDKKEKQNKKVLDEIRKHFKDDFFIYTLKIEGKYIKEFIQYCLPKDIINLFEKKSYLELMDIFVKESKPFLKYLDDEK